MVKAVAKGFTYHNILAKEIKQGNNKLTQLPPSKTNTWLGG